MTRGRWRGATPSTGRSRKPERDAGAETPRTSRSTTKDQPTGTKEVAGNESSSHRLRDGARSAQGQCPSLIGLGTAGVDPGQSTMRSCRQFGPTLANSFDKEAHHV